MRNKFLSEPTTDPQSQAALTVSTTTNIDYDDTHVAQQNTATESKIEENKKDNKFENKLFIHHTYEKRFRSMKRDLHQVHKDIFNQSATKNVKMIVGNRNRRNATHKLIQKRPKKSLLKNQQRKSE
jgi:hypothetical protein